LPATRNYKRMTDQQLSAVYRYWSRTLDDWHEFASRHAGDRRARRGARRGIGRCNRQIRRISTVARRRRLGL
jgi:hypothetical protein